MTASQIAVLAIVTALVLDLLVRIAALLTVPKNRRPSAALAWLLAIFLVPFFGIAFYGLIGQYKLPKKRRAKQARVDAYIRNWTDHHPAAEPAATEPDWFPGLVRLNGHLGSLPLVGGNAAHLISGYADSIAAMTAAVDEAREFVHCEFYIIALDEVTEAFFVALGAAVARGVSVRVLMDHVASARTSTHRATVARLDAIGVEWRFMLPVRPLRGEWQRPDLRNHRKLLVIDDRIGFVGSQNLIARTYDKRSNLRRGLQWQDLMAKVEGPAVQTINALFITDWFTETDEFLDEETVYERGGAAPEAGDLLCQVVPSGPGFDGENNLQMFLALLYQAREQVIITSPYFVPDEAMLLAIVGACSRGVDVQLFVSEIGDQGGVFHAQRSYYEALLRAGVTIWMYPGPFILHAKHVSVDDAVAVIGSSNMDIRSFALDLEISLLVHGADFVREMRAVEAGYRAVSTRLLLESWLLEPRREVALDSLARLTSALQ